MLLDITPGYAPLSLNRAHGSGSLKHRRDAYANAPKQPGIAYGKTRRVWYLLVPDRCDIQEQDSKNSASPGVYLMQALMPRPVCIMGLPRPHSDVQLWGST